MITLMVFTNGRDDLLERTLCSFMENVNGPITKLIINDDTGDLEHWKMLNKIDIAFETLESMEVLQSNRAGFNGAIRNAWAHYRANDPTPFVFHLEDDFIFNREIDLWEMMGLLDSEASLAQVALMRQPWNQTERDAGSLYKLFRTEFKQITHTASKWVEHNMWFTTNPSLYKRELVRAFDWPEGNFSEGNFTHKVREEGYHFAYMGSIVDDPWVTHIGYERASSSHGY